MSRLTFEWIVVCLVMAGMTTPTPLQAAPTPMIPPAFANPGALGAGSIPVLDADPVNAGLNLSSSATIAAEIFVPDPVFYEWNNGAELIGDRAISLDIEGSNPDNLPISLQRREGESTWTDLAGVSNLPFSYIDTAVFGGRRYHYRLKIDTGDGLDYTSVTSVFIPVMFVFDQKINISSEIMGVPHLDVDYSIGAVYGNYFSQGLASLDNFQVLVDENDDGDYDDVAEYKFYQTVLETNMVKFNAASNPSGYDFAFVERPVIIEDGELQPGRGMIGGPQWMDGAAPGNVVLVGAQTFDRRFFTVIHPNFTLLDYRGEVSMRERKIFISDDNIGPNDSQSAKDPSGAVLWLGGENPGAVLVSFVVPRRITGEEGGAPKVKLTWSDSLEVEGYSSGDIFGGGFHLITFKASSGIDDEETAQISYKIFDEYGGEFNSDFAYIHLKKAPDPEIPSPSASIPFNDMTGPRYRKVALNGRPMPDEKPQATAESDEAKEQTYVDAFNLQVNHSTTDVYLQVPGSDLSLSVRRNSVPMIWNLASGLRPHERPDLPFGAGWTSNIGTGAKIVSAPDEPLYAHVPDENGAMHSFAQLGPDWLPIPSGTHEAKELLYSLTSIKQDDGNGNMILTGLTLQKKFGGTVQFDITDIVLSVAADRESGSDKSVVSTFFRTTSVADRLGYSLAYTYAQGDNEGLIPNMISASGPGGVPLADQQIYIRQLNNRVTDVWDCLGNRTSFTYAGNPGAGIPVALSSVSRADGSAVGYSYEKVVEVGTIPREDTEPLDKHHMSMTQLTNGLGKQYGFIWEFDQSHQIYVSNKIANGWFQQTGLPRLVSRVSLPDGGSSSFASARNMSFKVSQNKNGTLNNDFTGFASSIITDTAGVTTTYAFTDVDMIILEDFASTYGISASKFDNPRLLLYQTMVVNHAGLGIETFTFKKDAGLALNSITDFSGNVTSYTYNDPIPTPPQRTVPLVTEQFGAAFFDDPNVQTRYLGGAEHSKIFSYDANRIMTQITDESGRSTDYVVDSLGRRLKETIGGAGGQVTDFTYDTTWLGVLTSQTIKGDANHDDLVTDYVIDSHGRVQKELTYPDAGVAETEYVYDLQNNKRAVYDPLNHITVFDYDARNRITRVTHHDDVSITTTYDAAGNITSKTNENGVITSYIYDSMNRPTVVTTATAQGAVEVHTAYNRVGSPIFVIDSRGTITFTDYDAIQRPVGTVTALGTPDEAAVVMEYGANSGGSAFNISGFKPTQVIDPRGNVTDVSYDDWYRPTSSTVTYTTDQGAAVATTSTTYDLRNNPVSVTDPLNKTTATVFDILDRPTLVTFADNTSAQTEYTATGLVWKVTDQRGAVTESEYDGAGRPVEVIAPETDDGVPHVFTTYDLAGNVITVTDPKNRVTDTAYDVRNRPVQVMMPEVDIAGAARARPTVSTSYDAVGNALTVTDARGATATTEYDELNRPTKVIPPAPGLPTSTTYDLGGNPLTVTQEVEPGKSVTTTNIFDSLSRLVSTTSAAGITVTSAYDKSGNKTSVTDGVGNTTLFAYDGLNRLLSTADPAGVAETSTYNAVVKTGRADSKGQSTTYSYDDMYRLLGVNYVGAAGENRNYTYDAAGNILTVVEPDKGGATDVANTYDIAGRLKSEVSAGVTYTHKYDLNGNRRETVVGSTGRTLTSVFDEHNRLATLTEGANITSYSYDANGNTIAKTLPNGQSSQSTLDALNRLSSRRILAPDGATVLQQFDYLYDAVGNVTQIAETYAQDLPGRVVSNEYDDAFRLTKESVNTAGVVQPDVTTYTYDQANNRIRKTQTGENPKDLSYTYNNLNQLTAFSDAVSGKSVTLTYDANGNRITRTSTDPASTTGPEEDAYGYDRENRLTNLDQKRERSIGIAVDDGAGNPEAAKATAKYRSNDQYAYVYDYRTRRVERDERGTVTRLSFLGGTSYQEHDVNTGNPATPDVEYLRGSGMGGGVGGLLYTIRGGVSKFNLYNSRGDVVGQTDATGALTYQASYEAFGQFTKESGSTLDRQKSNTKDLDPTGYSNEGFRYRELETGIFLTRDPLGFVDGPNMYAYVVQNPWSSFDPDGLFVTYLAEKAGGHFGGSSPALDWMASKSDAVVGTIQGVLMAGSAIPGAGKIADVASAFISAAEGNYTDAGLVAVGGVYGKAAAKVKKGIKAVDKGGDAMRMNSMGGMGADAVTETAKKTKNATKETLMDANKIELSHPVKKSAPFSDPKHGNVADLAEKFKKGDVKPEDIPAIGVAKVKGKLRSANNRRLRAAKLAEGKILTKPASKTQIRKIKDRLKKKGK